MWFALNDAFLSVVDKANDPDCLLVRARRKGDIENVFGLTFPSVETPGNDYLYRAEIPRRVVANVVRDRILAIDYDNFKDSVDDDRLHDAYASVWGVMARLQPGGPYGHRNYHGR